jgi:hypothetical protein
MKWAAPNSRLADSSLMRLAMRASAYWTFWDMRALALGGQ